MKNYRDIKELHLLLDSLFDSKIINDNGYEILSNYLIGKYNLYEKVCKERLNEE